MPNLKIIWKTENGEKIAMVKLRHWQTHGSEWIAQIIDFDDQFTYKRSFCPIEKRVWSRSGKNGDTYFLIEEAGYYEYREPRTGGADRCFLYWDGQSDEMIEVDEEDVIQYLSSMLAEEYGYYVMKNHKDEWAIFHKDNPEQPVSKWWDAFRYKSGLLVGESEYYIAQNSKKQWAIFHISNPEQPISQWWYNIARDGLIIGKSQYYLAQNKSKQWAIFHKDNPNQPISQWWNKIHEYGFFQNDIPYYMVENERNRWAIFHKDIPDQPISQWWFEINNTGLLNGQSDYYMVKNEKGQYAIFHKDDPDNPVSQFWKYIHLDGCLKGETAYYIAETYGFKMAIFHKDNPNEPVTNWHYYIYPFGLVNGTSECYAVQENNKTSPIYIYHVSNSTQPLYELSDIHPEGLLYFNDKFAIYLTDQHLMMYDNVNMEHNIIMSLSEELRNTIQEIYKGSIWHHIHPNTNRLIFNYLEYNFLPIAINIKDHIYCDLYTLDQGYIGRFDSIKDAKKYMQQEIAKKDISYDFMRLY